MHQRDVLLAQIAVGRLCKPEAVAAVMGFLASDPAVCTSGQAEDVIGGMDTG